VSAGCRGQPSIPSFRKISPTLPLRASKFPVRTVLRPTAVLSIPCLLSVYQNASATSPPPIHHRPPNRFHVFPVAAFEVPPRSSPRKNENPSGQVLVCGVDGFLSDFLPKSPLALIQGRKFYLRARCSSHLLKGDVLLEYVSKIFIEIISLIDSGRARLACSRSHDSVSRAVLYWFSA